MNEDFVLDTTLPNVRRLYSTRWTMKAFPFKDAMDPDDPMSIKPRAEGLVNAWTEDYCQGLLNQATEYHHEGNYKAAIASLNEAIQSYANPPLSAFNVRAVTHIKLGNLSDAFKDAARMIRKYESHPTGYLRLAQVLKMQGKPADALRIYDRGLLRVPSTDHRFKDIQASRNELSSILARKKLLDPLQHLPKELALEIMGHTTFRDIVRASQVCRAWRAFTFSHPIFWSQLDLRIGKRSPSFTTVRAYLQRSKGQIWSISLPNDSSDVSRQGKVLDYISHPHQSHSQLREFPIGADYISHSHQPYHPLGELVIGADSAQRVVMSSGFSKANVRGFEASPNVNFDFETVYRLLNECPVLEYAIFGSVTRFSGLHRGLQHIGTFNTLRGLHCSCAGALVQLDHELIKRIPNVQNLGLERFEYDEHVHNQVGLSELHQLETLRLFDSEIFGNLKMPTSLKSISLERSVCEATVSGQQRVHVPELKWINLSRNVHRAGPMNIQALLSASRGNVEHLNLNYMSADRQYMADVFREQVVAKVEALGLAGLPVSDDNLANLGSFASRLKRINLSSTSVSGVGVKALVNGCKDTLTWIKLDNCRNVSPDAIDWARSCGIEVSYYFRDTLAGGRAVRDI